MWLVLAMFSTSGSAAVTEFGGIVQIRVGDESAWAAPHGEGVQLREGVAPVPTLTLTTDIDTLLGLLTDDASLGEDVTSGALVIDGDESDAHRFLTLYEAATEAA